jgi:hypothetical protein
MYMRISSLSILFLSSIYMLSLFYLCILNKNDTSSQQHPILIVSGLQNTIIAHVKYRGERANKDQVLC